MVSVKVQRIHFYVSAYLMSLEDTNPYDDSFGVSLESSIRKQRLREQEQRTILTKVEVDPADTSRSGYTDPSIGDNHNHSDNNSEREDYDESDGVQWHKKSILPEFIRRTRQASLRLTQY